MEFYDSPPKSRKRYDVLNDALADNMGKWVKYCTSNGRNSANVMASKIRHNVFKWQDKEAEYAASVYKTIDGDYEVWVSMVA